MKPRISHCLKGIVLVRVHGPSIARLILTLLNKIMNTFLGPSLRVAETGIVKKPEILPGKCAGFPCFTELLHRGLATLVTCMALRPFDVPVGIASSVVPKRCDRRALRGGSSPVQRRRPFPGL